MKNYIKKFENIGNDLKELKTLFTTSDKDIIEIGQALDSVKLAMASNKKQLPAIKLLEKRVNEEKTIIKKYVKSGEMKDKVKKNLVFTQKFTKERERLMKKVEKTLNKHSITSFDVGFANAIKTFGNTLTSKYPQKGGDRKIRRQEIDGKNIEDIPKFLFDYQLWKRLTSLK